MSCSTVKRRKRDSGGHLIGTSHSNPFTDTSLYEVEFDSGETEALESAGVSGEGVTAPKSPVSQARFEATDTCTVLGSLTAIPSEAKTNRCAPKTRGMMAPLPAPPAAELEVALDEMLPVTADAALPPMLAAMLEPTATIVELTMVIANTAETAAPAVSASTVLAPSMVCALSLVVKLRGSSGRGPGGDDGGFGGGRGGASGKGEGGGIV